MKKERVACKQLKKYVDKHYGEKEEDIGFLPDTQNEEGYSWNFELDGKKVKLTYLYSEKQIIAA